MLTLDGRAKSQGLHISSKYANLNGTMGNEKSNGTIMTSSALDSDEFMDKNHLHRHMWIVTGPAGCGKTTVAQFLALELGLPYIEGDDVSITVKSDQHKLYSSLLTPSCSVKASYNHTSSLSARPARLALQPFPLLLPLIRSWIILVGSS